MGRETAGFDVLLTQARASRLARLLPRATAARNRVHEADAELVEVPGGLLAVTVDGLADEPQLGLLRDPWTLGWAAVVHGLSDLAAVAAEPLGVLLSWDVPADTSEEWVDAVAAGVRDALEAHGTGSLGGDMNEGATALTCTALGWIPDPEPLTRRGARAGDRVLATGPLGVGHLVGTLRARAAAAGRDHEALYRPRARLAAARAVRRRARAAVDTSDGLLASLDILVRLAGCGVRVRHRPELYHPEVLAELGRQGLPDWLGAAFGMGEYELLVAVAPEERDAACEDLAAAGATPREVAVLEEEPGMRLELDGAPRPVDADRLLDLFSRTGSVEGYLGALVELDRELRLTSRTSGCGAVRRHPAPGASGASD